LTDVDLFPDDSQQLVAKLKEHLEARERAWQEERKSQRQAQERLQENQRRALEDQRQAQERLQTQLDALLTMQQQARGGGCFGWAKGTGTGIGTGTGTRTGTRTVGGGGVGGGVGGGRDVSSADVFDECALHDDRASFADMVSNPMPRHAKQQRAPQSAAR
jgi:hypothetical protein